MSCQVSVGCGAICYKIIALMGPGLIWFTIVSAAEMQGWTALPQMDVDRQCQPLCLGHDPAMSSQVHHQMTRDSYLRKFLMACH